MNLIEFNVWDIEMKQMITWDEIQSEWESEGYFRSVFNNDHYIPLQYINRLDKAKQKLFVGDILIRDSYWSIQIEQEKGSFMVRDIDKVRRNNLCINEPIYNWYFSEWTKVGNIYENPELLEEV